LGLELLFIFAPISSSVVGGVAPEKRGIASGVLGAIRQAGGTFGLTVVGSMLMNIRRERFDYLLKTSGNSDLIVTNEQLDCITSHAKNICNVPVENYNELKALVQDAYNFAFHWIYLLCAVLVFLLLPQRSLLFQKRKSNKRVERV